MRLEILFLIVIAISGCASQTYRETQESKFTGALDVRWVKNDYFLFLPNKDNPFMLIRTNGQSIQPGLCTQTAARSPDTCGVLKAIPLGVCTCIHCP